MLKKGIEYGVKNMGSDDETLALHRCELVKAEAEWKKLGADPLKADAVEKARRKDYQQAAELQAITQGLASMNPGKAVLEFGGPQTQAAYEKAAALPPSAHQGLPDKRTCDYCKKGRPARRLHGRGTRRSA